MTSWRSIKTSPHESGAKGRMTVTVDWTVMTNLHPANVETDLEDEVRGILATIGYLDAATEFHHEAMGCRCHSMQKKDK